VIYIDTSSFLKLILEEPESAATDIAVSSESSVLISSLTELESSTQLRALSLGGRLRVGQHSKATARLSALLDMAPFQRLPLVGSVFDVALLQLNAHPRLHCRSLDRLHLAAMEQLKVTRLMTHDAKQRDAALALGFSVETPR
jgi:predicted nucleic acid-binding protein